MSAASALTRRPSLAAIVDDQSDTNHPAALHSDYYSLSKYKQLQNFGTTAVFVGTYCSVQCKTRLLEEQGREKKFRQRFTVNKIRVR